MATIIHPLCAASTTTFLMLNERCSCQRLFSLPTLFFTCQCMSAHGALNYSAQFWPRHFLYVTAPVIIFLLKVNQVENSNGNFRCVSMAVVFPTTKTQSTTATEVFFDEQGRRRSATRSPRSQARLRRGSPASCCLATAL